MTSPLCKYSGCERPIERGQYGAEGDEAYAERVKSGYCRKKCQRLDKPSPSPRDRPALVADPTSWYVGAVETVPVGKVVRIADAKYLEWVRSLPCLVPGCQHAAEAHHQSERGNGGTGTRADDYRALPLCPFHHTLGGTAQAQGSYHGMGKLTGWKFWKAYGIDVETVIHDLNRAYIESGRKFKEG